VLAAWRNEVAASLPADSNARVSVLGQAPASYLIQIDWPDVAGPEPSALRLAIEP
jgi:hypothetical protein